VVEIVVGQHQGLVQVGDPHEFARGQFHGSPGLRQPGLDRGEFGGPLAFPQVRQPGLGLAQPLAGLPQGRALGALLEGEKRAAGLDARAFRYRQVFQLAGERRRHIDELALEIALPAGRNPRPAARGREGESRGDQQGDTGAKQSGVHGRKLAGRGVASKRKGVSTVASPSPLSRVSPDAGRRQ